MYVYVLELVQLKNGGEKKGRGRGGDIVHGTGKVREGTWNHTLHFTVEERKD